MMVIKSVESFSRGKKSMSGKMTHRVCDNRKIGVVNFTCLKREDGLPWIIKFGLTSWPMRGLPAWVRPYSTKGKREKFCFVIKS